MKHSIIFLLFASFIFPGAFAQDVKSDNYDAFSYKTKRSAKYLIDIPSPQRDEEGKLLRGTRQETIDVLNSKIIKVTEKDPGAVRFLIVSRDRMKSEQAGTDTQMYGISKSETLSAFSLYALEKKSGLFISHEEYLAAPQKAIPFADLDQKTFRKMVIAAYEQESRHFEVIIDSVGKFHRDWIIDQVKQDTAWGQRFIQIEKHYLTSLSRAWWEEVFPATSNEEGSFILTGEFSTPTDLLRSVQIRWRGEPHTMEKITIKWNGQVIFDEPVLSYEEYGVFEKASKTEKNRFEVIGVGGKINTEIEIVFADCGCGP